MSEVAILGAGETGLACLDFLARTEKQITVFDANAKSFENLENKGRSRQCSFQKTDFLDPNLLARSKRIIISPGISSQLPAIRAAVQAGIQLESEIELFAKAVKAPVVAITGSNGKSTVTTWLAEMAKAAKVAFAVGGNLGPPALSLLSDKVALYILELSSFQLEHTYSLAPQVATILNISPDHLDRYNDSLALYLQAKLRIFQGARQVVLNRAMSSIKTRLPKTSFGLDQPLPSQYGLIKKSGESYLSVGDQALLLVSKLRVVGRHNIENALATLALAQALKLPQSACLQALCTYTGLPHRCEVVAIQKEVIWINDSKGTNMGATLAALKGLAGLISKRWILILGGRSKGANFSQLLPKVAETCQQIILFGEAANEIKRALNKSIPCIQVDSLKEAVCFAHTQVHSGGGVLFSPACSSFDTFENFKARGNCFKQWVKETLSL